MDTEDNGDVGFKQNVVLNCPSSGIDSNSISSDKVTVMAMCSESMFKSPTGEETFYGSGWDPLVVPLNHGHNFNGCGSSIIPHSEFGNSHYSSLIENKPVGSSSHLVHHYTSDSAMVNMVSKIPCFGSGNFSDMTTSFGPPGCSQVADANFHQIYTSMKPIGSQEDVLILEEGAFGGKKKRKASESTSPLDNKKKNVEREQQKDPSENSSEHSREKDEMKQKMEQNNTRGKQPCKQTKDNNNSMSEEPSKETYIHMRAKRGQATNSHSLAERVRRERISERMRLLQELVPGCNKITGKAVMLDEIINYVQSLQQQVEFLSMKLATVNPEVNFDLDRIFSKDILHPSRGINAANLNIGHGSISSSMFPGIGFPHGTFPGIPDASPAFHPLPQSVWDNELHNLLQMGFDSDTSTTNPAQNARAKLELWSSREK